MTEQDIRYRYAAVPDELKQLKIWACWSGRKDGGNIDMSACNPMADDPTVVEPPAEWTTYDEAVHGCAINGFAGVGISVSAPYFAIRAAGCSDPVCDEIVGALSSYNETTRDGIVVICSGDPGTTDKVLRHPEIRLGATVELMSTGQFVPLTGDMYDKSHASIEDGSASIDRIRASYIDRGGVRIDTDGLYDMTDTGNARRMRDVYGDRIRYSYAENEWHVWDGKRWAPNDSGQIKQLADNVITMMRVDANKISDGKEREVALRFIRKTESHVNKENMIKECQHLEGVPVAMDDLDNDDRTAGLINCVNGIVDLRTGKLLPHDPALMITKICSTEYDKQHRPPETFLRFLDDVTRGDSEMQAYLKRCVGYTLTGLASERCAFFLYGMGRNGKSTFADIISTMLGSYSANTQADTLLLKGRELGGSEARGDIARLKSIRMATCQEPDEGARIKEGLLKQLTGGTDVVTARFLYGKEFQFLPRFAPWICTNHKPIVRGTDDGIWDRIKLIPFEVTIPDDKIDRDLPRKLRRELPQILAWAVEGAIEWYEHGLQTPDQVMVATADYKKEMDLVASFVDACLEIDYNSTDRIMASDLFAMYIAWARANNEYEMTSKKFGMEITKKVPDGKGRDKSGIYYRKIKITDYGRQFVQKKYTADQFK